MKPLAASSGAYETRSLARKPKRLFWSREPNRPREVFRSAFAERGWLIPADGFYEWQKLDGGKQPMYIRVDDGEPFAFAGLYEVWHPDADGEIISCTIVTTGPNKVMKPIHDHMPVILPEDVYDRWLDPEFTERTELQEMLRQFDAKRMDDYPVSWLVNSPTNNDERRVTLL